LRVVVGGWRVLTRLLALPPPPTSTHQTQQVNYLALTGLSNAQLASMLGHNAQAMAAFSSLHNLLHGLLPAGSTLSKADVAAQVVQAVYDRIQARAPTNASKVCWAQGQRGQHVRTSTDPRLLCSHPLMSSAPLNAAAPALLHVLPCHR
jgi:hypothetical protein